MSFVLIKAYYPCVYLSYYNPKEKHDAIILSKRISKEKGVRIEEEKKKKL